MRFDVVRERSLARSSWIHRARIKYWFFVDVLADIPDGLKRSPDFTIDVNRAEKRVRNMKARCASHLSATVLSSTAKS